MKKALACVLALIMLVSLNSIAFADKTFTYDSYFTADLYNSDLLLTDNGRAWFSWYIVMDCFLSCEDDIAGLPFTTQDLITCLVNNTTYVAVSRSDSSKIISLLYLYEGTTANYLIDLSYIPGNTYVYLSTGLLDISSNIWNNESTMISVFEETCDSVYRNNKIEISTVGSSISDMLNEL